MANPPKDSFNHIFAKITDDKLEQLEMIADPKNRMKTEEKLAHFAQFMLDDLNALDNAKCSYFEHLCSTKFN